MLAVADRELEGQERRRHGAGRATRERLAAIKQLIVMAWHAGTYSVIKDGKTVDTGSYMEVLRKKGGKWLIVRDIWNSSTPPAAAPPPPAPAPAAAPKK